MTESLQSLRTMPYLDYLKTRHWKQVREAAYHRAENCCRFCNISAADYRLHVHHKTYVNRGCEKPDDLVVLCADCHFWVHRFGRGGIVTHFDDFPLTEPGNEWRYMSSSSVQNLIIALHRQKSGLDPETVWDRYMRYIGGFAR